MNDEYTTARTLRLMKAEWTAPLQTRLDAVVALHSKETRWTNSATEEYTSYETREEAIEAYLDIYEGEGEPDPDRFLDSFDLCAECCRLVKSEMDTNGIDEWSYSEQWPCNTAVALGVAEKPRFS